MKRRLVLLVLIGALVAWAAAPAAAKPGRKPGKPGGDSSIVLDQPAPIHHGDVITFSVQTSKTDRPHVLLTCHRGGQQIYWNTVGMFDDYYRLFGEPDFLLSSTSWTSGEADCLAELQYRHRNGSMRTITSLSFHVFG
jgi:hypothetical protein